MLRLVLFAVVVVAWVAVGCIFGCFWVLCAGCCLDRFWVVVSVALRGAVLESGVAFVIGLWFGVWCSFGLYFGLRGVLALVLRYGLLFGLLSCARYLWLDIGAAVWVDIGVAFVFGLLLGCAWGC